MPTWTGWRRVLADPTPVIIDPSDAGAHVQMLCSSGDSTLLLTRHVRERGDFSLEWAVHQLTGRQSEVFGFHGHGGYRAGQRGRSHDLLPRISSTTAPTSSSTTSLAVAPDSADPKVAIAPRSSKGWPCREAAR